MSEKFDVVIIGGGPGGYVTAIRSAQLGFSTALIEKEHLGGTCLNLGCIPTKALLRAAEIKHWIDQAKEFGLDVEEAKINLTKMVEKSRQVSSQLVSGIKHLLKKNKIKVFEEEASLLGSKQIKIIKAKIILKADHIILATGAKPRILPGFEPDKNLVWTSKQAIAPEELPKSLLIVGSGAIGIEFASFYKTLNTEIHVVEIQDRILPQEDLEISTLAKKLFEKQGFHFYLSSSVEKIEKQKKSVKVFLKTPHGQKEICVDKIIVAVGVVGNTKNLGLEKTKVKVEKGQILTNEWGATHEEGVYAIGDVAGAPWLAHKASHEGIICIEKIAGLPDIHPLNKKNIPACTYSFPQIASIGLTEEKAKELGYELKIGRFPFKANGKALTLNEREGLIKTIFDSKTDELLGAHMIGAEVTELIQGFSIAKTLETTEKELMHTIFPHPTLSEMMHESVLDAYGRALHF